MEASSWSELQNIHIQSQKGDEIIDIVKKYKANNEHELELYNQPPKNSYCVGMGLNAITNLSVNFFFLNIRVNLITYIN